MPGTQLAAESGGEGCDVRAVADLSVREGVQVVGSQLVSHQNPEEVFDSQQASLRHFTRRSHVTSLVRRIPLPLSWSQEQRESFPSSSFFPPHLSPQCTPATITPGTRTPEPALSHHQVSHVGGRQLNHAVEQVQQYRNEIEVLQVSS